MPPLVAFSIGAAVLSGLASSCRAAPADDACQRIGLRGLRPPMARVEIDRAAATEAVFHIKRACEPIGKIVRRIDGLPIMIVGEEFAGKRIDWENGPFVLRNRGAAPER